MSLNPFMGMGKSIAGGWVGSAFGFGSKSPVIQGLISFGMIVAIGLFIVRETYEIVGQTFQNPGTQADSIIKIVEAELAKRTVEANTGKTEAERKAAEATAHWAEVQSQANAEKAQAEARQAQAGADKAEAEAELAKMQTCKTQAEAAEASGINKYDVPSFLTKECRTLLKL